MVSDLVAVRMIRDILDNLPWFDLPAGYALRYYQPGDAETWLAIQQAAERYHTITPAWHAEAFGLDEILLRERQCFLLAPGGRPIGTATAWLDGDYRGEMYGRIHWVAIVPEMQGRGLAKPLLAEVCRKLVQLGHTRAYLTTHSARIPAINLYASFGFVPEIADEQDLTIWRDIQRQGARILLPSAGEDACDPSIG